MTIWIHERDWTRWHLRKDEDYTVCGTLIYTLNPVEKDDTIRINDLYLYGQRCVRCIRWIKKRYPGPIGPETLHRVGMPGHGTESRAPNPTGRETGPEIGVSGGIPVKPARTGKRYRKTEMEMRKEECEVPPCRNDSDGRLPSKKLKRKVLLCRPHIIIAINMGHFDCVDCGNPFGFNFTDDNEVICNGCEHKRKEKLDGSQ